MSNVFFVDADKASYYIVPMRQSHKVIKKFNGVYPLSRLLGHKHPSTVQGWWESGWIHPKHHKTLIALAKQEDVDLVASDFVDDCEEESA